MPKGALVAVLLCLEEVFAKVEIVRFDKRDQNLALQGALITVLLYLGKFFVKVEIVEFDFKLHVGFRFKLFVRFGFKLLVGFEFKFSAYIYSFYGYVFCVEKIGEM